MSRPLIRIHLRKQPAKAARDEKDGAVVDLTAREAGQIIVIFALMLTFLIGMVGIAIDATFAWRTGLQIQTAADAGALAGVVYLPGDLTSATAEAVSVSGQNGYVNGGNATVSANNNHDSHQLDVTVTSSVPTFFVRLFGINNWTITRAARAGFQLPVPMGSPENFYGVYCLSTPANKNCPNNTAIPGAASTTVYSHGSFGANMATGTDHGNGDAFIPYDDFTHSLGTNSYGGSNPNYDPNGYNYAVELPAGGTIYVFDPTACSVGGQLGTGDHYVDTSKEYSITTRYQVFDMTNSPLNYPLQPRMADSGGLFANEFASDQSGTYGTVTLPAKSLDNVSLKDCRENAPGALSTEGRYWHDKWWPVYTSATAGTFRLNITSAARGSANDHASFENCWSIEAVGGASASGATPRVYGLGKIVSYNIIPNGGAQQFYLAQIGPENAGKTLEIDLFDIGDISGTGTLSVMSPDGNTYNAATFSYLSDANCGVKNGLSAPCSGSTNSVKVTDSSGHQSWQDSWLTISIKLPAGYGCSSDPLTECLKPAGETQQGWWKIQYSTTVGTAANDTTTWMVSLVGNPVHLLPVN